VRGVEVRLMDESDRGMKDAKSDFERDCAGEVRVFFFTGDRKFRERVSYVLKDSKGHSKRVVCPQVHVLVRRRQISSTDPYRLSLQRRPISRSTRK